MLQPALERLPASLPEAEQRLRIFWGRFLSLPQAQRSAFLTEVERTISVLLTKKERGELTEGDTFLVVFLTDVCAIHSGLAAPFVWQEAVESSFRPVTNVQNPSPYLLAAATLVFRVSETFFLANPREAQLRFETLLQHSAMGVPLLALLLRAYGEAAVGVLPHTPQGAPSTPECIAKLKLATESFSLEKARAELTIAHPILMHVARISGNTEEALKVFRQPILSVNPVVSGVGLTDYVAYCAETALIYAASGEYEYALYALLPLSRLPSVRGVKRTPKGIPKAAAKDSPPWLRDYDVDGPETAEQKTDVPSSVDANAELPSKSSEKAYPWYRMRVIGSSIIFSGSAYREDSTAVDVVEWRNILSPTRWELEMDHCNLAWATRLNLLLLGAAFGGGDPQRTVELLSTSKRKTIDAGKGSMEWRGGRSAIPGHTCFPHPIFALLCDNTPLSIYSMLKWEKAEVHAGIRICGELLEAVAKRDKLRAAQCLASPEAKTTFKSDLTLDIANAILRRELTRHIVLDLTRLYSHVPLRVVLERSLPFYTDLNESYVDKSDRGLPGDTVDEQLHARAVIALLAQMCASGELETCHVCTPAASTDEEEPAALSSIRAVEDVAKMLGANVALPLATTTLRWTLPSTVARLEHCARLVQFEPSPVSSLTKMSDADPNKKLISLMSRLQALRTTLKADEMLIRDLQRNESQ